MKTRKYCQLIVVILATLAILLSTITYAGFSGGGRGGGFSGGSRGFSGGMSSRSYSASSSFRSTPSYSYRPSPSYAPRSSVQSNTTVNHYHSGGGYGNSSGFGHALLGGMAGAAIGNALTNHNGVVVAGGGYGGVPMVGGAVAAPMVGGAVSTGVVGNGYGVQGVTGVTMYQNPIYNMLCAVAVIITLLICIIIFCAFLKWLCD